MARNTDITRIIPSLRATLARLWPYLKQQTPLITLAIAMLVFMVGMKLLEPWPLKFLVDTVLNPGGTSRVPVPQFVRALDPAWLIGLVAAAVVVIGLMRAGAEYITRAGFAVIANRVLAEVRLDVYRHLQRLPLSFFSRSRAGDLVARVMTDVAMLRDVTSSAALPLVASVMVFVGMWTFMFILQWKLALATLAVAPLFALTSVSTSRKIHDAARKQRQREAALASTAVETIHGIKSVQAMGLEDRFAIDFDQASRGSAESDIRGGRLSARLERSVDVLVAIATATVIGYGALLVLWKQMSTGDLLVFLAYLRRAFNPMQDLAKYTGRLAKAAAAGERVIGVLDEPLSSADESQLPAAPQFAGAIAFENVQFGYREDRIVLRDLSFNLEPGETVAILGASGIGKSTTADMLLRFHRPAAGRITIDGYDILNFSTASVRKQIGVVLQDTMLFAGTVRENITCGDDTITDASVERALEFARASEFVGQLPEGVDSVLAERGATLSQGQRQRLAIARVAVRSCPILVLDEPTAGLDDENRRAVIDGLVRLCHGRTTLLITHDLELAASADRVIILADGKAAESGPPSEILPRARQMTELVDSPPISAAGASHVVAC